ncbi:type II secretion system protein, partial [Staphylococcus felis]
MRHNDGFTLLEMLFVISIIVLSLSLMITHPPRILSENQIEHQI